MQLSDLFLSATTALDEFHFHFVPVSAVAQLQVWKATVYLTPLIGAYLADAVMGRFWVILVFSIIYFIVSPGLDSALSNTVHGPFDTAAQTYMAVPSKVWAGPDGCHFANASFKNLLLLKACHRTSSCSAVAMSIASAKSFWPCQVTCCFLMPAQKHCT